MWRWWTFVDGIAKRCRDTLGERGDGGAGRGGCGEPLEGRSRGEREGGMEEEAPWVVDRGWRKCGTSNSPGLPTPAFPTSSPPSSTLSKRGARARSPSTLRKQLLSLDSILQGTTWGIPIHDDNRYLNRRFRFI